MGGGTQRLQRGLIGITPHEKIKKSKKSDKHVIGFILCVSV